MSAEEAQEYGLVDNILDADKLDLLRGLRENGEADASDGE
jgi:hypothetical protein